MPKLGGMSCGQKPLELLTWRSLWDRGAPKPFSWGEETKLDSEKRRGAILVCVCVCVRPCVHTYVCTCVIHVQSWLTECFPLSLTKTESAAAVPSTEAEGAHPTHTRSSFLFGFFLLPCGNLFFCERPHLRFLAIWGLLFPALPSCPAKSGVSSLFTSSCQLYRGKFCIFSAFAVPLTSLIICFVAIDSLPCTQGI